MNVPMRRGTLNVSLCLAFRVLLHDRGNMTTLTRIRSTLAEVRLKQKGQSYMIRKYYLVAHR